MKESMSSGAFAVLLLFLFGIIGIGFGFWWFVGINALVGYIVACSVVSLVVSIAGLLA